MFKPKDTIQIQVPKLSTEETEIIKQLGFCGSTKKLLQVYCIDCKTLVSVETYIQAHNSHSVLENDSKNAKFIFKDLKSEVDQKYEIRLKLLNEKLKLITGNLKDLEIKRSASRVLMKTQEQVIGVAEDIGRRYHKIESWIERYENESMKVLELLKSRMHEANQEYEEFNNSVEECNSMNPVINNYNLMDFSMFLDKKIKNDENYHIHEVPNASNYCKKLYSVLFCEVTKLIIDNLIQTFQVYGFELDEDLLKNQFLNGIDQVFESRDSNRVCVNRVNNEAPKLNEFIFIEEKKEEKKDEKEGTVEMTCRKEQDLEKSIKVTYEGPDPINKPEFRKNQNYKDSNQVHYKENYQAGRGKKAKNT